MSKSHSVHAARASFSTLVESALAGEPQRITRYGKESVILVSETDWDAAVQGRPNLGTLLVEFSGGSGFTPADFERPFTQKRPLGDDFQ